MAKQPDQNLPAKTNGHPIYSLLHGSERQIADALPNHMMIRKVLRTTWTAIRDNRDLLECSPKTVVGSVIKACQLGLSLDPNLGQAYLVPYKRKAQLIVGYKGLIDLARRSGQVQTIMAQVVRAGDDFEYEYGLNEKLHHKPALTQRGDVTHIYAYALLVGGGHNFEVMSAEEVEEIRQGSPGRNADPWRKHWDEMARKTLIRRLAKYLPISVEFQDAAFMDERFDAGIDQGNESLLASEDDEIIDVKTQDTVDELEADFTPPPSVNSETGEVQGDDGFFDQEQAG